MGLESAANVIGVELKYLFVSPLAVHSDNIWIRLPELN